MSKINTSTGTGGAQTSSSGAASSSSISTKPVHPVTLSSFAPTGCELSTWAYITSTRPTETETETEKLEEEHHSPKFLPNLVTVHANSIRVYVVDPDSGTLLIASSYENLAGTIISLDVIPCSTGDSLGNVRDGLLLGFAGHPRMSIVYPSGDLGSCATTGTSNERDASHGNDSGWSGVLTASSIIDLTPALTERSRGSVAPLEQDLSCSVTCKGKTPTITVILGGGVAVATFQLPRSNHDKNSKSTDTSTSSWWRVASEPYFLPLSHLSSSLQTSQKSNASAASSLQSSKYAKNNSNNPASGKVSHGFGDIISSAFLIGYTEPVLTLLHSNPTRNGGRTCPGRLAHHSSSTRTPLTLTAVSVSIDQKRSVVLWTLRDALPADAFQLYQHPKGGVLVVCVNEILYVDCSGKIQCCIALNGWVRSTASSALGAKSGINTGLMQPNPSPLTKLSIQLDGCRLVFVNKQLALISLRNGSLYSLELHDKEETTFVKNNLDRMCISLSPVGKKLGGLGMISTLSATSLTVNSSFRKFLDKDSNLKHAKKEELSETKFDDEDENKKDALEEQKMSLGLVFSGSRMGDSTLLMYGLRDKVKLIPLEADKETDKVKEKAIAAAVEEVERSKRKKDEVMDEDIDEDNSLPDKSGSKRIKLNTEDNDTESKTNLKEENDTTVTVSDDESNLSEEDKLRKEEEALYAPIQSDKNESTMVPFNNSNDEQEHNADENLLPKFYEKQLYRPQIRTLSMFQHVKVLDSLTGLGPIGSGCEGPIACNLASSAKPTIAGTPINAGSTMNIYPIGYGSSGGLAIHTSPGMNFGSTIISEADCMGIGSIYHCPDSSYVFLAKKEANGGCMILKLVKSSTGEKALVEVDLEALISQSLEIDLQMENSVPTFYSIKDILTRMNILSVKEFSIHSKGRNDNLSNIMVLAQYGSAYAIIIMSDDDEGKLSLAHTHIIGACDESMTLERGSLVSITILETLSKTKSSDLSDTLSFGCVWSSGHASVFSTSPDKHMMWEVREIILEGSNKENEDPLIVGNQRIVAIDMFSIADNIFRSENYIPGKPETENKTEEQDEKAEKPNYIFDEDDLELYGESFVGGEKDSKPSAATTNEELPRTHITPSRYNTLGGYISGANLSDSNVSIIAICRESSHLQLFDVAKLFSNSSSLVQQLSGKEAEEALVWDCRNGCGYGNAHLASGSSIPGPTFDHVSVSEMKFFFCGPTNINKSASPHQKKDLSILRSLCLLVETNLGDLHLYTGSKSGHSDDVGFKRVPLRIVARTSKEEQRHRSKLKRKNMIADADEDVVFQPNKLHRFFSLSGQDGLFSATARPLWFVSERGAPSALSHRLRHCAPSGGAVYPVSGFCSGLAVNSNSDSSNVGFITVHERIGRVGSQRITFFNGLSDIFTPFGLLPGGGQFIQKIPLGVTVRHIEYINNSSVSSAAHPLYALLIAREIESDQSHLNDDGLTAAEREETKRKKEEERMQKQVEADLGGFDVEQEWVEEIERENCFEIEKKYGGAPPIMTKTYEIWLVDASDWQMVDTYQLEEYEHGMAMKVMTLSDISGDGDSSNDGFDSTLFLAVGTGIVDADGEDVSSRGRILLFELKRTSPEHSDTVEATLNFVYEKGISIGPVTCLNNLTCENKSRLVVGAGAEVTIEQWGNGKLLQVGFFHANMHVQDIVLFKTFFLLSDAYDSLHFLVWRESDKSLTLLAKDYEPTCVYAAGVMSRGGAVSFVTQDDRQNLNFFSYAPNDVAARGGNKLVCRADHHIGTQTIGFVSHFCRSSLIVNSATLQSTLVALKQQEPLFGKLDDDQRFGLHYGSTDGGIGSIIPVKEDIYWRLAALQSVMSNALESDCSLSQRAWRLYRRTPRRGGCRSNVRRKGVIDGDLIVKYIDLSLVEQEDLASAIGSTVDLISDNLLEVLLSGVIV